MNNRSSWYTIRARSADMAEVMIYGDIGDSWSGESVTAQQFVKDLQGIQDRRLVVRINSYGGSVTDGIAIYNAIKRHPMQKVVEIDGVAVSIASLIAMAGDTVRMAENALFMVHAPWGTSVGNAADMREYADILDKYSEAMATSYAAKTGQSVEAMLALLTDGADHWFSAEEAMNSGFVDEVTIMHEQEAARFRTAAFARFQPPAAIAASLNGARTMTTNVTDIETAAQARERDRINVRNAEIRIAFDRMIDREGVPALYAACLADTNITAAEACEKLLVHLGKGAEPATTGCALNRREEDLFRDTSVGYGTNSHHGEFRAAIVDALLVRGGVRVKDPHPAVRDLRGMSLVDISATLLRQRGHRTEGMTRPEIIQAALTTSDLPALTENIATKAVMIGFRENEAATHRVWTREGELPDFKTAKRVVLSEAPGLDLIPEHAEFKHGNLSDAAEPATIATYGKILSITRQTLINDDLGELTRVPQAMGQAAARKEADLVYALLNGNPVMRDSVALFHANHGNLDTPAALALTSLASARKLMRLQKGIGGLAILNVTPRFLIVPAALEMTAEQLLAQIQPSSPSNAIPEWVRTLTVVVDARLDAASSTAWYLASAPAAHDTIEVLRLEGEPVSIESKSVFERDELRFKVRIDVGAAALDWRGLVKNAGA